MPKLSRFLVLLCSLVAAITVAPVASVAASRPVAAPRVPGAEQVKSTTLANGMTVIVWTDHDIPNIALYNWVRVGSRNEVPGITGLAHFFEHMMYNRTSKRAPGQIDRSMEAQGGSHNALKTDNMTVHQERIPRRPPALRLTATSEQL